MRHLGHPRNVHSECAQPGGHPAAGKQVRIHDSISHVRWVGALMEVRSLFGLNSAAKKKRETDRLTYIMSLPARVPCPDSPSLSRSTQPSFYGIWAIILCHLFQRQLGLKSEWPTNVCVKNLIYILLYSCTYIDFSEV